MLRSSLSLVSIRVVIETSFTLCLRATGAGGCRREAARIIGQLVPARAAQALISAVTVLSWSSQPYRRKLKLGVRCKPGFLGLKVV